MSFIPFFTSPLYLIPASLDPTLALSGKARLPGAEVALGAVCIRRAQGSTQMDDSALMELRAILHDRWRS